MIHTEFSLWAFDELAVSLLYDLLQLRQKVFVVEQNCAYLDVDGMDKVSLHLCGINEQGTLVAYARILPPNVAYPNYASIGRVISDATVRRTGLGRAVVEKAIAFCEILYPSIGIKIGAQAYLQSFYESFGFEVAGAVYLEDGIPHVPMLRQFSQ